MLDISIPLWIFCTAVGLPTLMLVSLMFRLVRIKRKNRKRTSDQYNPADAHPAMMFNAQIHRQLLEQQIDTVFHTLTALIESEQMKLKALIKYNLPPAPLNAKGSGSDNPENHEHFSLGKEEIAVPDTQAQPTVAKTIAAMLDEGTRPQDIARQLGISQTEVSLAAKLNRADSKTVGSKMKAVA